MSTKYKVVSIFLTFDGEVTLGGPMQWSVFVRLGGCNLRCWKSTGYCDAPHSLDINHPYPEMTAREIYLEIKKHYPCRRVTITGGEPLFGRKDEVNELSSYLQSHHYTTSLETSGSIFMSKEDVRSYTCVILDLKPPSTEMSKLNDYKTLLNLRWTDYVKFVLSNREDYDWAKKVIDDHVCSARIAFGPRYNYLQPIELIEWMKQDKLYDIQLNFQTHKFIYPNAHPAEVQSLSQVDVAAMSKVEV